MAKFHKWRFLEEHEECTECGIKRRQTFHTLDTLNIKPGMKYSEYLIDGTWQRCEGRNLKYCAGKTHQSQP